MYQNRGVDRVSLKSGVSSGLRSKVVRLDACASTMEVAAEQGTELGADESVTIVAETLSEARGSHGRAWSAPHGGLWFTTALGGSWDRDANEGLDPTALLAGLAVAEAVETLGPEAEVRLKWPNDVLLDGRKVCGILCETGPGGRPRLVGVGINANVAAADLEQMHRDRTGEAPRFAIGSLMDHFGRAVDLDGLLASFLERFLALSAIGDRRGLTAELRARIEARLAWRGELVSVRTPAGEELAVGRLMGLGAGGRLRVERTDGAIVAFASGEVSVRPNGGGTPTNGV